MFLHYIFGDLSHTLSYSLRLSPFSLSGSIWMLGLLVLKFSYFTSYSHVFTIFTYHLGISSTLSSNPFTELYIAAVFFHTSRPLFSFYVFSWHIVFVSWMQCPFFLRTLAIVYLKYSFLNGVPVSSSLFLSIDLFWLQSFIFKASLKCLTLTLHSYLRSR